MSNVPKHRGAFGALVLVIVAAVIASGCRFSGFNDPVARSSAGAATAWLLSQQQPDGGFEVAGFPGFETSDAILAIAENAQTEQTWSTAQARAAVANVVRSGKTPLHAIDDFADGTLSAGQAAKLIVLVAKPLGYAPEAFNPQNDGTTRNLVAAMNAGTTPDGGYGAFNATLYAAIAQKLATNAVPGNTLALIRASQEPSGGWDFAGNPTPDGTPPDVDSTALAMQALVSAGVPANDTDLRQGLVFLAQQHRPLGAFQSFGVNDPNSTSTAIFAIVAAGYDPTLPCWRNVAVPALSGQAYISPLEWLRGKQLPDGHIASPNDSFGLNTFATAQSVQALRRGWVPVNVLAAQACPT
jgi:hypothetical protein